MWQGFYENSIKQWGVGHGGFNSQSLVFQRLDRAPTIKKGCGSIFRIIYDCGSGRRKSPQPALKSALVRMLDDVPNGSTIDLLVISHFDRDHVNGLSELSKQLRAKSIRVSRVWAPILTNIEIILAISADGEKKSREESYSDLLRSPSESLAEFFPGADVSLIPADYETIPFPADGRSREGRLDEPDEEAEVVLDENIDSRGLVARSGLTAGSEPLWETQPYVVESTLVGARGVHSAVGNLIGKPVNECSFADLLAIAADSSLLAAFHSAVKVHNQSIKRSARTSGARTAPNLSTLCIYSGPVAPYDWCRFRRGWAEVEDSPFSNPIAPAWLGTGDAGLRASRHVDAMRNVFTQNRLDRVGLASVPHHGSRLDSDSPLWDALPNLRRVTIEANYGNGGRGNHHPHQQVLNELSSRNLNYSICIPGTDCFFYDKGFR